MIRQRVAVRIVAETRVAGRRVRPGDVIEVSFVASRSLIARGLAVGVRRPVDLPPMPAALIELARMVAR